MMKSSHSHICIRFLVLIIVSKLIFPLFPLHQIRILCGVDHDDLKQLIRVSKTINEAVNIPRIIIHFICFHSFPSTILIDLGFQFHLQTLIAKEWHFAYSTPSKVRAFRTAIEFDNPSDLDEIEAPNAPPTRRFRSPLNRKKLADISVALFAEEEEQWPKKKLPMETEM